MIVEFAGGCSLVTRNHMIVHVCVYSFTVLPVYVILPFQELHDKRYQTLILRQLI